MKEGYRMKNINDVISKRYSRVSSIYDWMDNMIKHDWRVSLLKQVRGDVLEVGVGTGANLLYYPEDATVTGIDFSEGMLKQAYKKISKHRKLKEKVRLIKMDAQHMEFPDHSFDFVISTCVFCSVPDPIQGLKEMRRVCKPEGKILMLEHMRSENRILGPAMDILNPVIVRLWGANINRRTLDNIHQAGLTIDQNDELMGTIMRRLILNPNKS